MQRHKTIQIDPKISIRWRDLLKYQDNMGQKFQLCLVRTEASWLSPSPFLFSLWRYKFPLDLHMSCQICSISVPQNDFSWVSKPPSRNLPVLAAFTLVSINYTYLFLYDVATQSIYPTHFPKKDCLKGSVPAVHYFHSLWGSQPGASSHDQRIGFIWYRYRKPPRIYKVEETFKKGAWLDSQ